jgi:hypothetical protein
MRLNQEIQSNRPNVFGTFLIDYPIQSFLEKFEPNVETLFRWIQLTRGGHYRGPWLGTNAANLLNQISHDYFAGKDLSDTTLTNVDLRDADLRGTRLKDARLSKASLWGSKFFREDIVFSKCSDTTFSFYVLKTDHRRKDEALDYYRSLSPELKEQMDLGIMLESTFRDDLLWELIAPVKDLEELEPSRDKLEDALSTRVAIYFDEIEELVAHRLSYT